MLTQQFMFTVTGAPIPKGSLKCVGQRGRHQLVEDNPRTRAWRRQIAAAAAGFDQRAGHWQSVGVEAVFRIDRPASHFGTGRNAHLLRDRAPDFPVAHGTGDVDKLLRLVLDALQDGHVLHDDAQVVDARASKVWADGDTPGTTIVVYPFGVDLPLVAPRDWRSMEVAFLPGDDGAP